MVKPVLQSAVVPISYHNHSWSRSSVLNNVQTQSRTANLLDSSWCTKKPRSVAYFLSTESQVNFIRKTAKYGVFEPLFGRYSGVT